MVNGYGEAPALPAAAVDLRQARINAGRSLEDIANRTKISLRFLRAIEAEEFEKLPGGIFNTSYLRQYAAEIGLPAEPLLQVYRSRMGLDPEQEAPPVNRCGRPSPWRWLRFLSPQRC